MEDDIDRGLELAREALEEIMESFKISEFQKPQFTVCEFEDTSLSLTPSRCSVISNPRSSWEVVLRNNEKTVKDLKPAEDEIYEEIIAPKNVLSEFDQAVDNLNELICEIEPMETRQKLEENVKIMVTEHNNLLLTRKSLLAPPPPPPIPPPPPPPLKALMSNNLKITGVKLNPNGNGNVEMRVKKLTGGPPIDMMAQLQNTLKKRQNRKSLVSVYENLS